MCKMKNVITREIRGRVFEKLAIKKIDLRNAFLYWRWFFFFVFEEVMQCVQQEENSC
jgi:hypothetical protein